MKIKLFHSSNVIGLYSLVSTNSIGEHFHEPLEMLADSIAIEALEGWSLEITCYYTAGDNVKVFRSTKPYPKEKSKVIYIHVPIPSIQLVSWGIETEKLMQVDYTQIKKYYTEIDNNANEFSSLQSYILSSIRKGIIFLFTDGFSILGTKIKLSNEITHLFSED